MMKVKMLFVLFLCVLLLSGCLSTVKQKAVITDATMQHEATAMTADSIASYIQLLHPSSIAAPEIMQAEFTVQDFPKTAVCCEVVANRGTVSIRKMMLNDQNSFIYYLPRSLVEMDVLSLAFFDENGKQVGFTKVFFEYDKENQEYCIIDGPPV